MATGGGMRLRIRATGGGATLRVQVPSPARFCDLRHALAQTIGVPADSIRLSLNKRDEIVESDASAPLEAYGIRPGDLLYYFDREVGLEEPSAGRAAVPAAPAADRRELCAAAADKRARGVVGAESASSRSRIEANAEVRRESMKEAATLDRNAGKEHTAPMEEHNQDHDHDQEHDQEQEGGAELEEDCGKKYCQLIPSLLSRLLSVEGQAAGNPQDLLILAIHAVMLETGFVNLDSRIAGVTALKYSIQELGNNGDAIVLLRCQKVGGFMVVYGSVAGSSQTFRLTLPVSKYIGDAKIEQEQDQDQDMLSVYRDVFALWKEIKDGLTLPLLMLLCEIAGLPLPACFQILPTELKMRVLELLPAVELAKISMVSSELRFLAGNDELWRQKFLGEMFKPRQGGEGSGWKTAFVREWYARRRRERGQRIIVPARTRPHQPWIFGGDYDAFPFHRGGVINPFGGPRFRRPLNPGCIGAASSGIGSGAMDLSPELPRPGDGAPAFHHLFMDVGDIDMDDVI